MIDLPDLMAGVAEVAVPATEDATLPVRVRLDGYGYRQHRDLIAATVARRDRLPAVLSGRLAGWDLTRGGWPIPTDERALARASIPLLVLIGLSIRRAVDGVRQRDSLARWLVYGGGYEDLGPGWAAMPEWYPFIVTAKEMNTHPWIVADLPETAGNYLWHAWALSARAAEGMAEKERQAREHGRRDRH